MFCTLSTINSIKKNIKKNNTTDFVFKIVANSTTVPTQTIAGTGYSTTYAITNTASVSITTSVEGKGYAFYFNTNYLSIDIIIPGAFTRTFWISTATAVANKGNVFSSIACPVWFKGTYTLNVNVNQNATLKWNPVISTLTQTVTWVFYAVTVTAKTVKLYANDSLPITGDSTGANDWAQGTVAEKMWFGVYNGGFNYQGYMNDMRMYARELTAAEILAIYNAGIP